MSRPKLIDDRTHRLEGEQKSTDTLLDQKPVRGSEPKEEHNSEPDQEQDSELKEEQDSEPIKDEDQQIKKPLEALHDKDNNTVILTLNNGYELTMHEPKGKNLVEAESWLATTNEERRSINFLIIKIGLVCSYFTKDGKAIARPNMEDFLDILDTYEAFEAVGKCLNIFSGVMSDYFERVKARSDSMGLSE